MTSIVSKPWGFYEVIEEAEKYTIKRIKLSYYIRMRVFLFQHKQSTDWLIIK